MCNLLQCNVLCFVISLRMKPRIACYSIVLLYLTSLVTFGLAIYDPRIITTTKSPNQRESILPWYPKEKYSQPSDEISRSLNRQVDPDEAIYRKPNDDQQSWSPWRKTSGSDIEQRTEIDINQNKKKDFNENNDFYPSVPAYHESIDPNKNEAHNTFSQNNLIYQDSNNFEDKFSPFYPKEYSYEKNDQDLYEGIAVDSTKPRRQDILISVKPKLTVAHYDSQFGVTCPDVDSTGQFIYPPDCKFFVNCWKGRAFVQPCAPGTLFNPVTLECDFPHKVECYSKKLTDSPVSSYINHLSSTSDSERIKSHTPKCPPHVTGIVAHPVDCKKFLHCANGGTFVMDCGPGTVFNPLISACDWPYNVKGCKDALISSTQKTDEVYVTPKPYFYNNRENYKDDSKHKTNKIECPEDFTGLLPHPENCKKFLQCANGITYIMDCGPGTAFNPLTTVCDWPHKVPSCKKDKLSKLMPQITTTTSKPWSYHGRGDPDDRPTSFPYNRTYSSHSQGSWSTGYGRFITTTELPKPTSTPILRITWKPIFNRTDRQDQVASTNINHNRFDKFYNNGSNNTNYQGQGSYYYPAITTESPRPTWKPVYNQVNGHNQHGNSAHNTSYGYHTDNHEVYGIRYPHLNMNESINQGINHPSQEDWLQQNKHQFNFPPKDKTEDLTGFTPGSSSLSHTDQGIPYDRQEYGRTSTQFSHPWLNQSNQFGGNIYVESNYKIPNDVKILNETRKNVFENHNSQNKTAIFTQPHQNTRDPELLMNQGGTSKPTITANQHSPLNQSVNQPWNQDTVDQDAKLREWFLRNNVYQQSTVDRKTDSKSDRSESKTNVFVRPKEQVQAGSKNSSQHLQKPLYPNGIYVVDVNGTRGHYIIKENEIDKRQSKSRTYNQSNLQSPVPSTQTDDSTYQMQTDHRKNNSFDAQLPYNYLITNSTITETSSSFYPSNNHFVNRTKFSVNPINSTSHPFVPITWPLYNRLNESFSRPESTISTGASNYDSVIPTFEPFYGHPFNRSTINSINSTETISPAPSIKNNTHFHGHFNNSSILSYGNSFTPQWTTAEDIPKEPRKKKSRVLKDDIENITTTTVSNISYMLIEETRHFDEPDTKLININSTSGFNDVLEPDIDSYDVDVLEDKNVWKSVLVFENKTNLNNKPKEDTSVIMKINNKNRDVDIFNIEAAPFSQEEPPFPIYYVPSVQPLNRGKDPSINPLTPISGQVIRLRGGSGPRDGYLEVQGAQPGWGIICDSRNSWTLKEAHIVCKQLGYIRGAEMAWQGRNSRREMSNWIAANSVICFGNETRFQSCKFSHGQDCRIERDAVGVRCLSNRVAHCRKDEIPHDGQCYHLADPELDLNHSNAHEYCSQRNSRLVDITSQAENNFLSEWLLQSYPKVESILTSGIGFTTLNRTMWLWEDSSRAQFRFTKWWPGWLGDKNQSPSVQSWSSVVLKRKFPCQNRPNSLCATDYFFWDIQDTTETKGQSYVCKKPYDDIGCIYGKGNQYTGTANVTSFGKKCLSWGDKKISHSLTVNVINREVREKLKVHNYCRNPNPNKESRPWCFAEPLGEREYCDIPSCGKISETVSLNIMKLPQGGQCKPKHFECFPGECIPSPWVCDGEEDCTNGADERNCISHLNLFKKFSKHRLEGYDVEKWLNTPLRTCALRCKEADFTCRSFVHKAEGNICLLSDSNIGLTGALKPNREYDYYEMKERSINCDDMYICGNRKCINQSLVCNGKNDCDDRTDENICTIENLDYDIRLAGSNNSNEGRVEVKVFGMWGQVCDDGFGMINADVICKELGFIFGALELRTGGFYGNMDPPTRFMIDQLKCRGNETTLRECDFEGWGVHNCQPEEAVGIICKTAMNTCQEGHWKCDGSPTCIPTVFICDTVIDCPDGSDESAEHCDAPFEIRLANGSSSLEGRVEVRHHGVWGTVCDDDFSVAAATVICRSLGYGGPAVAKKNGFFGSGQGPIWLDEVFCVGNETQLYRCDHNHWGQHNCDHNEDAGVICTLGEVNNSKFTWKPPFDIPELNINEILPTDCGKHAKDFNDDEDLIFAKVVQGSIAQKGTYPWQASIRIRGHSRSSHWCGAVVLSPLHVLTAAHCLEGYNKGTYFVRAGDYNTEITEGTEVEANIEDYYIHEEFRKGHRMNNDIALVLLKGRGIPLGKNIMPICLPAENAEYPAGLNCTISGFGSIETGKKTQSRDLRYGWIPLLDQSVCRAEYVYGEGAISEGMICAGYLDEGVDTCDGDSGGPLACYHNGAFTLYGITSWGQHCGKANKPGVYVRVAHYRPWIDQKIKESLGGR